MEPPGEAPQDEPETTISSGSAAASARPPSETDAPASEHTVIRAGSPTPPGGAVPIGAGGYGAPDAQIAATPRSLWWRFVAGSILIITATATAVALSSLLFLTDVAARLQPIPSVKKDLVTLNPGDPQTILIVGSDERSGTPGDPGRSDTTMLLRVDAEKEVLSLFSLPRDLKVDIAGDKYGVGRLNEAFTDGGVQKTLQTVQDLTGLEINHVVNVDFQGFADAVDAIGCVYVDVDRDYFNDNAGLYGDQEYAEIDVNAGYQRLCGLNALAYVRFRHDDNDIVRAARQQDFLSQARQQVPVREVLPVIGGGDLSNKLIDIFTKYTRSDIRDPGEVIAVLKAFVGVIDVPIKEVHFNGNLDAVDPSGIAYVTATDKQIDKAVEEFLGEEDTDGPRGGAGGSANQEKPSKSKKKKGKGGSKDGLDEAAVVDADPAVARFAATSARRLDLPIFYPKLMAGDSTFASTYDAGSRQYDIRDEDDKKQPAYKMVVQYTSPETVPEYYGVEGTSWEDPPILDNPSETREIDGRDYELFYAGDRLRLVAWHDDGNSYWVSNTLLQTLDEPQMLGIATSMKKYEQKEKKK